MKRLYLNIISDYKPMLIKAINSGQWIRIGKVFVPPLEFVNVYSRSWFMNHQFELRHPDDIIAEYEQIGLTGNDAERFEAFKKKVADYRVMNVDQLLLKAIEDNRYPPGIDPEYGR